MSQRIGRVNTYVKVARVSYLQRAANSFLAAALGVLFFFGSFGLLYWNEGRIDLSQVAETSIALSASGLPESAQVGDFVSVTGTLTTQETLGDGLFLKPGRYVGLSRRSEMYAWEEDSRTETTRHSDGSETRRTTYTYRQSWQEDPENSANFERSRDHYNPPKSVSSETFHVSAAKLGDYRLDFADLTFPTPSQVPLSPDNLVPDTQAKLMDNYLFVGQGTLRSPVIGDLRIRYEALRNETQATVLAALSSNQTLKPHLGPRNISIYRLFAGTRAEAIAILSREHTIMTWSLRGGGFMMMWMGMLMALEPLNVLISIVPFLGGLTEGLTRGISFVVAFGLSVCTILIANLLQNPVLAFLAIALSSIAIFRWFQRRRNSASVRSKLA